MNNDDWGNKVIDTAKDFAKVIWTPTEKNILHGYDENGVLVNTPDINYNGEKYKCGWWKPNEINQGATYNWGGCCTVEAFKTAIIEGRYAGNVPESRDNRTSRQCIGVDCSGLVTVCWELNKKQSTRSLLDYVEKLDSIESLLPGDILLLPGSHVMLFSSFHNSKRSANIIDATRNTGKVSERIVNLSKLLNEGYSGYRMKR